MADSVNSFRNFDLKIKSAARSKSNGHQNHNKNCESLKYKN